MKALIILAMLAALPAHAYDFKNEMVGILALKLNKAQHDRNVKESRARTDSGSDSGRHIGPSRYSLRRSDTGHYVLNVHPTHAKRD